MLGVWLRSTPRASLSGAFLQTHSEHRFLAPSFKLTPSIAFRHRPPNSEHRFPAPSSKLRASLSDTVLQTPSIDFRRLPPNSGRIGYATEGHSLFYISAQLSTNAASAPERFGYKQDSGSSIVSKDAREH